MPNLSDLFSAGGFLKWDGAGNTDADYTSQAASDLAADAAFTGAFAALAGTPDFVDGIQVGSNMTLVSEDNPTVNVLQFGADGSGVLKEQHVTTADQTGTGEAAKLVFNPGMSNGSNQAAASVTIATGRATGNGGGGTGAGGFIRFSTSEVSAAATDVNSTTTRWEIAGTGILQPGGDNLYNIGSSALRVGSIFLATSIRCGSNTATTGVVRGDNNVALLAARNGAGSGNVEIVRVTAADKILIGNGGGHVQLNGTCEIDGALDHDGTTVGFYGTTPIAKQTGVAVDAAGIHAALVALGLIAA